MSTSKPPPPGPPPVGPPPPRLLGGESGLKPTLSFSVRPEPPKPPSGVAGADPSLFASSQRPSQTFKAKPEPPALPQTRVVKPVNTFSKGAHEAPSSPDHSNLNRKELRKVQSLKQVIRAGGGGGGMVPSADHDTDTDEEKEDDEEEEDGFDASKEIKASDKSAAAAAAAAAAAGTPSSGKKRTTLIPPSPAAAAAPAAAAGGVSAATAGAPPAAVSNPGPPPAPPPGMFAPSAAAAAPAPQPLQTPQAAPLSAIPPSVAKQQVPSHSPVSSPKSLVRPILMSDPRWGYADSNKHDRAPAESQHGRAGSYEEIDVSQIQDSKMPTKFNDQPAQSAAASVWSPVWSEEHNAFYWYNSETKVSTWDDMSYLFAAKSEDKDVFGRSHGASARGTDVRGSKALSSLLTRPLSLMALGGARSSRGGDGSGSSHGSSDVPILSVVAGRKTHVDVVAEVRTKAGTHQIVKPKGTKKKKPHAAASATGGDAYAQQQQHEQEVAAEETGPLVRALYDFRPADPNNPDELPLRAGDELHLYEQGEDGWYGGTRISDGRSGLFPSNYVVFV